MSERAGSPGIRLAVFAALSAFAAAHWAALVTDPPIVRALLCVLAVTAGGAALSMLGATPAGPKRRSLLAISVLLATLAAALAVIGLPVRLLLPWNWGEFGDVLYTGLEGIEDVDYPYAGHHPWSRQVILLALPVTLAIAAALAFWPRREPGRLRTGGLAIVVGVYATAVIMDSASHPLLRGLVLFLLVAAWLWLPRVGRREATAAVSLIAASAALAVPLASALDAEDPWLDYRDWKLDLSSGSGGGEAFDWDHSYGPLDWARTGKRLLEVESESPHYWRAAVLDSFDGVRWRASSDPPSIPLELGQTSRGDLLAARLERRWVDWVEFDVEALRSPSVITQGLALSARGDDVRLNAAGASASDGTLEEGDSYALFAYAPAPSEEQMRRAPDDYPAALRRFTAIDGPAVYGPAEALARTWTADAPTTYDAVKAIEARLQNDFVYSEDPPDARYPLRAFLLTERVGYCQQFSGAMALMLRTLGIPSRVVAGFSPGERDGDRYVVRDYDAHSWVEVYFGGIGWVPFDPTPNDAPAQSQRAGLPAPLPDQVLAKPRQTPDPKAGATPAPARSGSSGGISPWIPAVAIAAVLLLVGLPAAVRYRRCRALSGGALADLQLRELEAALRRLDRPIGAGMTLRELERRHGRRSVLAGYAARLRAVRYAGGTPRPPTLALRRRVRRELSSRGGLRARVRCLLAIPPGGPRPGLR